MFIFLVLSKSILDAEEDICGGGGAVDGPDTGWWKMEISSLPCT